MSAGGGGRGGRLLNMQSSGWCLGVEGHREGKFGGQERLQLGYLREKRGKARKGGVTKQSYG